MLCLRLSSNVMQTFRLPAAGERPIAVEEAQRRVLDEVRVLEPEEVRFTDAAGRVLREDVRARADLPPGDNSAMDGYAVRAEDIASAPVTLRVIEDIRAGVVASQRVIRGTASRIMTGALIPEGADTVVQVELTDGGSEEVAITRGLAAGSNIRRRGEDMRVGDVVLRAGIRIGPPEIGVLASVQKIEVRVGRQPTIAIVTTGDEIIDVDTPREHGKVVNSNAYALAAMVRETGAIARQLPIVPDRRDATIAAIESALDCDFIVSTGGVSVGAYDFVKDALDSLGAETKFWRVSMKPGKPVVLSRVRDRLFFGLPGNPVSCLVSFTLFVAPAIRKASGQTASLLPPIVNVRAGSSMKGTGDRRNYVRVRLIARGGELIAEPMPAQGSGVSTSMVQANAFVILEEGVERVESGAIVPAMLIAPVFTP